ncbi:hypothetical protein JW721_01135 [Candidatus Micrarchaeota archaeon]|nr:hypothetical protein [Candidatus Micrarchaeota archaeon]
MRKELLIFIVLFSLSFASPGAAELEWHSFAFIAAISALGVLAILYMISYLVDSPEMRMLSRQEVYQVGITMLIIVFFISFEAYVYAYMGGLLAESFGGEDASHIDYAMGILTENADEQWGMIKELTEYFTMALGSMASSSATCSIMGTSLTYPGCIGIQVPFSSLVFATNTLVTAMLTSNSQIALLNLAEDFFFPVMLPLGLFLRCFQFSRGAGGLLIGISAAFYFVFPISIILTQGMLNTAEIDAGISEPSIPHPQFLSEDFANDFSGFEVAADCNPLDMDQNAARKQGKRLTGDNGDNLVDPLLFYIFIGGLFNTMLNLMITLSAARALSKVFGAEVDISALARIA